MHALELSHFVKKYRDSIAVNDISFTVEPGEFFGFLGRNGAGKTSTISAITGIARITSGTIKVFGKDVVTEYREARMLVGLSPQEFNVDIFAPTEKILWYMGGFYGMTTTDRKKRISELLKILDLEEHKNKTFMQLSGGLKRRVLLARAMIHDPKLLILDEPTAGVDVELRLELWKYLKEINKLGKTIVFTSHYLEEVEELCERIAIIDYGKIIADAPKADFTKDGSTLEAKFLSLTAKKK